jgi:hypothetical protein
MERHRTAGPATHDNIIRLMRIACGVPKATDSHLEYEILITFFTATKVARTCLTVRYTCTAFLARIQFYLHSSPCCIGNFSDGNVKRVV